MRRSHVDTPEHTWCQYPWLQIRSKCCEGNGYEDKRFECLSQLQPDWEGDKGRTYTCMRGSTVVCPTKCHVVVTWEVLQAFLRIATMFAVSIPNVWPTIDKLVTQGLQPWASRDFCDSMSEVDWYRFHLHIMYSSPVLSWYSVWDVCSSLAEF